jgi:hypothetical protein
MLRGEFLGNRLDYCEKVGIDNGECNLFNIRFAPDFVFVYLKYGISLLSLKLECFVRSLIFSCLCVF